MAERLSGKDLESVRETLKKIEPATDTIKKPMSIAEMIKRPKGTDSAGTGEMMSETFEDKLNEFVTDARNQGIPDDEIISALEIRLFAMREESYEDV